MGREAVQVAARLCWPPFERLVKLLVVQFLSQPLSLLIVLLLVAVAIRLGIVLSLVRRVLSTCLVVGYLEPGCSGVGLVGYRSFRRAGCGPLAEQQRPARPALLLAQGLSDAALVGLAGVHRLIELLRLSLIHI